MRKPRAPKDSKTLEGLPDRIESFGDTELANHFIAAFGGELEKRDGFPPQVRLKFSTVSERDAYLSASESWLKQAAEDPDFLSKLDNPLLALTVEGDVKRLEGPDLGIAPCPESDPSMGDKTPAVIRWWFKHHPEEAKAKYDHRTWDRSILSDV